MVDRLDCQLVPDLALVQRAFGRVRARGGFAMVQCCINCGWRAARAQGASWDRSTLAVVEIASLQVAFPAGRDATLSEPLDIHHRGDGQMICDALEAEGLRVEWGGDEEDEIRVLPALPN